MNAIKFSISAALSVREDLLFLDAAEQAGAGRDLSRICWRFLEQELMLLPSQPIELQNHVEQIRAGISALANGRQFPDATEQARAVPEASEDQALSSRHALLAAMWAAIAAGTAATDPERCSKAAESCLINSRHARAFAAAPPAPGAPNYRAWRIGLKSEARGQAIRWLALLLDSPAA